MYVDCSQSARRSPRWGFRAYLFIYYQLPGRLVGHVLAEPIARLKCDRNGECNGERLRR